jgi:hypothetical protein
MTTATAKPKLVHIHSGWDAGIQARDGKPRPGTVSYFGLRPLLAAPNLCDDPARFRSGPVQRNPTPWPNRNKKP